MTRIHRALAVGVLTCLALSGCGGGGGGAGGGGGDGGVDPKTSCTSLSGSQVAAASIGLPTHGAVVTSALLIPASPTAVEYCEVRGRIDSVDPVAQPILFEADLPSSWNGKLAQLGGSGWDGSIASSMNTVVLLAAPSAKARAYVTFGSDGGHESANGDATFAMNAEQLRNFGGDHLKKTRDAVVGLVKMRYGASPSKTYFIGGSNGGREAFAAFQRWPDDYDGVIAMFPAFDWTALFMKLQQIGLAMRGSNAAGWFSPAKAATLTAATLAMCDELDGAKDGVIGNVDGCKFNPATLRCTGGMDTGDTCFSDPQLHTLSAMTSQVDFPYTLANGTNSFQGFNVGADWGPMIGTSAAFSMPPDITQLGQIRWFADGMIRYVLLQDANANTLTFDPVNPGPLLARLQQVSAILDQSSTDISAYLAKGGKLILLHGQADSLVATHSTLDYYQHLVARFGQSSVDEAVRLYLVPGYGHDTGAFNPEGTLPLLDALESWVERGSAPGSLVVGDANPATRGRTRPMCVYPAWPKYVGGDVNQAASFACIAD
ncbi:MAG: tannase/feruloyl esterase family alpha/beta hydrolase [Betaproteobacteria bacterium]